MGTLNINHPKIDLLQHQLREAFRLFWWEQHHHSKRRDAYPTVPYHADYCAWARKQADEFHRFQILVGGTISPACFSVQRKENISLCSHCKIPNTVDHAWTCEDISIVNKREQILGDYIPQNPFSKRTAWPSGSLTKADSVTAFLVWLRSYWLCRAGRCAEPGPAVPSPSSSSRLRSGSAHCNLELAVEVRTGGWMEGDERRRK